MQRVDYKFDDLQLIKKRIYALSRHFDQFQICDSNQTQAALDIGKYELIAGFGVHKSIDDFETLEYSGNWKFGLMQYPEQWNDPKGKLRLFEPQYVVTIEKGSDKLNLYTANDHYKGLIEFYDALKTQEPDLGIPESHPDFRFTPQTSKVDYINTVEKIRKDILLGVFYEMNYCIEFKSSWDHGSLLPYMGLLNERSAAPFSIYAKIDSNEILCSSPERFMCKYGDTLYSQPIKGTNPLKEGKENRKQMQALKRSEKERAENVMIVDLVRNDLAHVCNTGTIKVEELFGTYPFKTLNHLISTVSGQLQPGTSLASIFEALFPMGSMTGAPKLEVMKHIQLYEDHKRGIYSGCMGYISPDGDFDFNVMIRTLVYDTDSKTINYKVGSAITYDSVAENEYEECLLKGDRLEKLFT